MAYIEVFARYGRMTVFSEDTGAVGTSLRKYAEWAELELQFLRALVEPGDTVLDVGGYIGTHALAFSSFVGADGKVISIEAQPESFKLLKKNTHLCSNVDLINAVATSFEGEMLILNLDVESPANFGAKTVHSAQQNEANVNAKCWTVDCSGLERCDLIKIDVEGMEYDVLQGSSSTLDRLRPFVYAECNTIDAGARAFRELQSQGFDTYLHLSAAFNPENFASENENIFGVAMEVAIVGVPGRMNERFARVRGAHTILSVDNLDDLAFGMGLKPQYKQQMQMRHSETIDRINRQKKH